MPSYFYTKATDTPSKFPISFDILQSALGGTKLLLVVDLALQLFALKCLAVMRYLITNFSRRMYVNVPRVTLKLEYHSSSGKDASTVSNHAKEWGCVHTSPKRERFKQLKIAYSRPYCRRFGAYKSGARDDLASSLNCDRRFRFFKTTSIQLLFVLENLPLFFSTAREALVQS